MKAILLTLVVGLFSTQALAFNCHGTEPFWGAEVTDSMVTLEAVDKPEKQTYQIKNVEAAIGTPNVTAYSDSRGPVAVVKQASCSDGMSDDEFGQEVMIFTTDGVLYGCCGAAL